MKNVILSLGWGDLIARGLLRSSLWAKLQLAFYGKLYFIGFTPNTIKGNYTKTKESRMTDDVTGMPPNEEPAKSAAEPQLPALDEMPTMIVTPPAPGEAPQPTPAEATLDDMSTVTIAPDVAAEATHAMPADVLPSFSPTVQATPQATPAPTYEQFGDMTEAVQPAFYPGTTPAAAQPQYDDPAAYYAQGQYAPYPAQPGMPLPGQFLPSQPGAPVPVVKKRHTVLWATVALIAVLLIGGGTVFAYATIQANASTPTKTLQQYCHGFMTQNAQEVYDTYSAASKEGHSLSDVQQGFDLFKSFGSYMKIASCTVSDVQQNGSTASGKINVVMSMSLGDPSVSVTLPLTMELVLENNVWKIDISGTKIPNIQVPNLPMYPTVPPYLLTPTVSS